MQRISAGYSSVDDEENEDDILPSPAFLRRRPQTSISSALTTDLKNTLSFSNVNCRGNTLNKEDEVIEILDTSINLSDTEEDNSSSQSNTHHQQQFSSPSKNKIVRKKNQIESEHSIPSHNDEYFSSMAISDIKSLLKKYGFKTSGYSKQQMINRLIRIDRLGPISKKTFAQREVKLAKNTADEKENNRCITTSERNKELSIEAHHTSIRSKRCKNGNDCIIVDADDFKPESITEIGSLKLKKDETEGQRKIKQTGNLRKAVSCNSSKGAEKQRHHQILLKKLAQSIKLNQELYIRILNHETVTLEEIQQNLINTVLNNKEEVFGTNDSVRDSSTKHKCCRAKMKGTKLSKKAIAAYLDHEGIRFADPWRNS